MRKKAVELARGQDEEKVGISLKIPKNLKDRLQLFSETQSVSMNSLIVSCIELMLDDSCGNLLKHLDRFLEDYIGSMQHQIETYSIIDREDAEHHEYMKRLLSEALSLLHQVRSFL